MATLVLGLGNILLRDEGVGVHVARHLLAELPPTPGLTVLDGGTLGLELLPYIEAADHLLVLDSARLGKPPGSVSLLRGAEAEAMAQGGASAHELALPNVLVLARLRGRSPEEVAIVAVEPAQIETGLDLSPQVAAAVEPAAALAKQVLLEWKAL